jgi:hypothetical protein
MHLSEEVQQALLREISAYAQHIPDPQVRDVFTSLYFAVESGELKEEHLEPLGHVLAVCLESGRIRRLYGPHVEMQAERLFAQTPQGQRLLSILEQTNRALAALAGQTLEDVSVSLKGPGSFHLHIRTDRARLRLLVDRSGIHPLELETS